MKMKFSDYLLEAPLPSDWDGDMFNERVPFTRRVKYAQERAKKIGSGSSRIAFVIPYEGRDTVLKIAKNGKGMAQNEAEVQALNDYYLKGLGLFIPMIDYDEQGDRPTWIHTELATKAKPADFVRATGGTLEDLMEWMRWTKDSKRRRMEPREFKIDTESELVQSLEDYIGNYDPNINDFGRLANWGIYDGSPVVIDVGLDDTVYANHYSRR